MKQIECAGSPYEIGFKHGSEANQEIGRGIAFYAALFLKTSNQSWAQVRDTASIFDTEIKEKWPRYYQELQGVAAGSHYDVIDIIALNVRTEIAFGLFSDGCTSLYIKTEDKAFLGQNWDWMEEQKPNLIVLKISQDQLPTIKMVTEAGIIGKIGLNSQGVGVCLNAIRAKGMNSARLPVHLGLRMALESSSMQEAAEKLQGIGMASSAHILIADASEAVGLEFTSRTFASLSMDSENRIIHSNHLLAGHDGAYEPPWLPDSPLRVEQMRNITGTFQGAPSWQRFSAFFEDKTNYPTAICRAQEGSSHSATLFNIVMELCEHRAVVKLGMPSNVEETIVLDF